MAETCQEYSFSFSCEPLSPREKGNTCLTIEFAWRALQHKHKEIQLLNIHMSRQDDHHQLDFPFKFPLRQCKGRLIAP